MRFVAGLMAALAICTLSAGLALSQSARVKIIVNGVDVPLPAPAVVTDGQVMAPISGLFEPMGAIAAFYEADRSVVVTNRVGVLLRLRLNETAAVVNGRSRALPVPPALIGQHIFVPAQAVFSALGAWTKFEESENTLYVSSQITSISTQTVGGVLQVNVDATGPIQVETSVLTNPDRLVVDFFHSALRTDVREYAVNAAGVMRIRTAQFQIKPYVSRMVFDLSEAVEIRVTTVPTSFSLTLEVRPQSAVTPVPPPLTTPPSAGPPDVPEPQPSRIPPGALKIMGFTFQAIGTAGRLVIEGSGMMQYKIREFVFPDRLAIDIQDAVFIPVKQEIAVDGPSIGMIRAAQFVAEPPVTRVVVTLKRKMNYVVSQAAGQLILEIGGSEVTPGHVVAIDPGHGGRDPGAIGPTGLRESDVVLDIALRIRDMLTRDGVRVVMLREADVTVELVDRPRVAREKGATMFVSIHANASPRASINGTETYYLTPQSLALAQMIQDELATLSGIPSRGIKTASFVVLRDSGVPTVLVETAYISHADGEAQLRESGFRQRTAEAVYRGIARFLALYPVPVAP